MLTRKRTLIHLKQSAYRIKINSFPFRINGHIDNSQKKHKHAKREQQFPCNINSITHTQTSISHIQPRIQALYEVARIDSDAPGFFVQTDYLVQLKPRNTHLNINLY